MIGDFARIDFTANTRPNRKPKRIARGQNHHALAAQPLQCRDQRIKWAGPAQALRRGDTSQLMMAIPSDNDLSRLHNSAGRWQQTLQPILTDTYNVQPSAHATNSGRPADNALTAAEAIADPPRRPRRATKSQPRGFAASSALDSAAPTKPTGNPRITAGFGAP